MHLLRVLMHEVHGLKEFENQHLDLQNGWDLLLELWLVLQTGETVLNGLSHEYYELVVLLRLLDQIQNAGVTELHQVCWVLLENAESVFFLGIHRFLRVPGLLLKHEDRNFLLFFAPPGGPVH